MMLWRDETLASITRSIACTEVRRSDHPISYKAFDLKDLYLALHGSYRKSGDKTIKEQVIQESNGKTGDQTGSHQRSPEIDVAPNQEDGNADTHHLLDRERIELLKHGAVVVNTGRGALIDTDALISALESGQLGGAALDVLEDEEGTFYADYRHRPIPSQLLPRLQALPNVVISPHTAYYTDHALEDTVRNSILNCLAFERGARPWRG